MLFNLKNLDEMTNNNTISLMQMFAVASDCTKKDIGVEIIVPEAINGTLNRYLKISEKIKMRYLKFLKEEHGGLF